MVFVCQKEQFSVVFFVYLTMLLQHDMRVEDGQRENSTFFFFFFGNIREVRADISNENKVVRNVECVGKYIHIRLS